MTRFFDILFSGMAIIVLTPFMLPIMLLLKLTGEHYIFYGQPRVGKNGEIFKVLKFATMLKDSPNMPGGTYTQKNDPRMLPMGPFLRKTKINELPQLLNIFIGQMSVIGYRPLVPKGYNAYPEEVKEVLKKSVPGLSGIGSIVFRNEEEILQNFEDKDSFYDNVIIPYKGKVECWYAENKSLLLYFKLIYLTVIAVISPEHCNWRKLKGIPLPPKELEEYL